MPPVSTRVGRVPRDALVAHLKDLASAHGDATLTLERGPFQARVRVRAGRVIEAKVDALDGERALLRALGATHGTWSLSRADGTPGTPLAPLDDLLAMLDARRDHIHAMAESVGGLDRVWAVLFRVLRRELPHIPDDVNPLLRLVDGRRSIDRILAESPFDEILTLRILHRLLAKGILIVPDLPDGVASLDDAQTSAVAELFAQSLPPTSSVADDMHSTPPMSTTGPPRVEPRPLPTADDDGDGAPRVDVGASAVTLKAWSSKREKPPGALPDDGGEALAVDAAVPGDVPPRVESPAAESPAAESLVAEVPVAEVPLAEVPLAESPLAESPLVETPLAESHVVENAVSTPLVADPGPVVVSSPSTELVDWLDEEHAFFTRDAAPATSSPPTSVAPASHAPDRLALYAVLFVVSILLFFAIVRLVTQGPSDASSPVLDVPVEERVESPTTSPTAP